MERLPGFLERGINRRKFLGQLGIGALSASVLAGLASCSPARPVPITITNNTPFDPATDNDTVPIPKQQLKAKSELDPGDYPSPMNPEKRLGYALVGLGALTLGELMPAFGACKYSKPVALVSGHRDKAMKVASQYGIAEKNVYSYENFDEIKNNPEIDIVYIVLPNNMHYEFTIRAANAGKHVLCEKPMANSVKECEEMIEACKKADRKLMVAYRIQYEPHNRLAMEWTRNKQYGKVKVIDSANCQNVGDPTQWRLKKAMSGGGAVPDIGIYCLNSIRFLLGEEPEAVMATSYTTPGDERFREVEETVMFQLFFPGGTVANCTTSYGVHESRHYRAYADNGGWFGMDPAFNYRGLQMEVSQADGKLERKQMPKMGEKNQFSLEMDHMSLCVMNNRQPYTPGEEGLQDMRIIEAIYKSIKEGKKVNLEKYSGLDVFRGTQPQQ